METTNKKLIQLKGLSKFILKGILTKGYKVPTPIQRKAIPAILQGGDVVAMARTGSGKKKYNIPIFWILFNLFSKEKPPHF